MKKNCKCGESEALVKSYYPAAVCVWTPAYYGSLKCRGYYIQGFPYSVGVYQTEAKTWAAAAYNLKQRIKDGVVAKK